MKILDASDDILEDMVRRYKTAGRMDGGTFSLAEIRVEQLRRRGTSYSGREVCKAILEISAAASDGLVTYMEIWARFHPNKSWSGNASVGEVRKVLDAAVHYCLDHELPIMTAIVVQSAGRRHSDKAEANMCEAAREWGRDVGVDLKNFIAQQMVLTRALKLSDLP